MKIEIQGKTFDEWISGIEELARDPRTNVYSELLLKSKRKKEQMNRKLRSLND